MRRAQGDVAVPLSEDGGSAADGQLGAVHYGGARACGRAALFLQVMAVAAVSALLTLVAGKVHVRIQFGDRPTLFPRAATPRVVRTSRTRDVSPAKYLVKTRSTISLNWQKQQSYSICFTCV